MTISRKTKTVKLLLDLFNQTDNAISVVELVSTFSSEMNKTTVYRILKKLEDSGVLHSFLDKDGLKRYARGDQRPASSKKPILHPHFLCEECGISSCLPIKIFKPSIPNYIINSSQQLHLGKCEDCRP